MSEPETEASLQSVPAEYLGVWKRSLLTTKEGTHDTSSQVYWLQTEHLHCDLRVPPAAGQIVQVLSDCSDAEHLALATQYAFAGRTEVMLVECPQACRASQACRACRASTVTNQDSIEAAKGAYYHAPKWQSFQWWERLKTVLQQFQSDMTSR